MPFILSNSIHICSKFKSFPNIKKKKTTGIWLIIKLLIIFQENVFTTFLQQEKRHNKVMYYIIFSIDLGYYDFMNPQSH